MTATKKKPGAKAPKAAPAPSWTVLRNGERVATVTDEPLAHAIAGTYCASAKSARIIRNSDRKAVALYCYGHREK
jgi:hypothetical protein